MTNDQANAANVLEVSLDLIRQILIKHESAVIAEFKSCIEAKKHELQLIYAERDEWRDQAKKQRPRADAAERELAVPKLSPWILTSDRLPRNGDPVIVFDGDASHMSRVAYYETAGKGGWRWCGYDGACNPKAWMLIPTFKG